MSGIIATLLPLATLTLLTRTFVNPHGPEVRVDDLHIEYSQNVGTTEGRHGPDSQWRRARVVDGVAHINLARPVPTGGSYTVKTVAEGVGDLFIKRWWWTSDGERISAHLGIERGDEPVRHELTLEPSTDKDLDPYAIFNKSHHFGGMDRLEPHQGTHGNEPPVTITVYIADMIDGAADLHLDENLLVENIAHANMLWMHCMMKPPKAPRTGLELAGETVQPNHGAGQDPAVMAPGPTHSGVVEAKFRTLTERECEAANVKYPHGLTLHLETNPPPKNPPEPFIVVKWKEQNAKLFGYAEPVADAADPDRTSHATITMKESDETWHLVPGLPLPPDEDSYVTNNSPDQIPKDKVDFFSVYLHEMGHALCFYHAGHNELADSWHFADEPSAHPAVTEPMTGPAPVALPDLADSPDVHRIFFATDRTGGQGGLDLWLATAANGQWSATNLGPAINSPDDESDPFLASDGTTLFFSSNRGGTWAIYRSVNRWDGSWSAPAAVLTPASGSEDRGPTLRADMRTLYFSSTRPGGQGGFDLWASEWMPSVGFSEPWPLGTINSPADDRDPHVAPDGAGLLFSSNRTGGAGGFDLWVTKLQDGWEPPAPVGAKVNTSKDELGPAIAGNGALYLTSGGLLVSTEKADPESEPEPSTPVAAPGSTSVCGCASSSGTVALWGLVGIFAVVGRRRR